MSEVIDLAERRALVEKVRRRAERVAAGGEIEAEWKLTVSLFEGGAGGTLCIVEDHACESEPTPEDQLLWADLLISAAMVYRTEALLALGNPPVLYGAFIGDGSSRVRSHDDPVRAASSATIDEALKATEALARTIWDQLHE